MLWTGEAHAWLRIGGPGRSRPAIDGSAPSFITDGSGSRSSSATDWSSPCVAMDWADRLGPALLQTSQVPFLRYGLVRSCSTVDQAGPSLVVDQSGPGAAWGGSDPSCRPLRNGHISWLWIGHLPAMD